jgi:hypothetical protein
MESIINDISAVLAKYGERPLKNSAGMGVASSLDYITAMIELHKGFGIKTMYVPVLTGEQREFLQQNGHGVGSHDDCCYVTIN